jgi:c-di-GMP-binding flagellar brake protein YcgR
MMVHEDKPLVDRREHTRFAVNTEAFVILPFTSRRGRLINISEGGLAFQYTAAKRPPQEETVSIQVNGAGVLLEDMSLTTVYDIETRDRSYFEVKSKKRCGAKFNHLTQGQAAKLEYLIRNYTLMPQTWF